MAPQSSPTVKRRRLAAELRRYAVRRMRDDGELQQATSNVNGLFDRLVAIVGSASGY